jgi:hypothetical protein
MTRQLNSEGVDQAALAESIEQWITGNPDRTATQLAQQSGVHARGIWQIRRLARPEVSLDWADRLTLAMDVPLGEVAPASPDDSARIADGARCGKKLDRHMRCITPEDLKLAYELHWRGVPLNRIATTWQRSGRITYKNERVAASSMWGAFKARGWPRRDRIDMVRAASTKHGRAGRSQARAYGPDYAAYRRQQRKQAGYLRDVRCASMSVSGEPCKRFALAGTQHCVAHEPSRAREREKTLQRAWSASRARMLRWGDHAPQVEAAIAEYGRPAVCRASGICSTVLGKMLKYDADQRFKPETWHKLQHGFTTLSADSRAAT